MKPEILELRAEHIHQQVEIVKHREKMEKIRDKVAKMFREDRSITFEDFKDARNLMDEADGFEFAAIERLYMPRIDELIIENILKQFLRKHDVNFMAIKEYFRRRDDQESIDNIDFFDKELDKIIKSKLREIIFYMKYNLNKNPTACLSFYKPKKTEK